MGFWLTTGVADQALEWTLITADQRAATKAAYAAAGIKLMGKGIFCMLQLSF